MLRQFILIAFLFIIGIQAKAQVAAVECPSGNRLYFELDNPLRVFIPGVKPELFVVQSSSPEGVKIRQKKDSFWVRPTEDYSKILLRIGYKVKGGTKWLREIEYYVREPKFKLLLGAAPTGYRLSKGELSTIRYIQSSFGSDFPVGYYVQPAQYEWIIISYYSLAFGKGNKPKLSSDFRNEASYLARSGASVLFRVSNFLVNGKPASFPPKVGIWYTEGSFQHRYGISYFQLSGQVKDASGHDTSVLINVSPEKYRQDELNSNWQLPEGRKQGRWKVTAGETGKSGLSLMEFDYNGDSLRRAAEYYPGKGISKEVLYDSARPTGTFRMYYPSGKLFQEVRFLRNRYIQFVDPFFNSYLSPGEEGSLCLIGPIKRYHENGQLKTQGQYDTSHIGNMGCIDVSTLENEEGELYPEFPPPPIFYSRRGIWEYFDEKGKLIRKEVYDERGYLIRE